MSEISTTWLKIFAFFGIACFAGVVVLMTTTFVSWLKDKIEEVQGD